MIKEFTEFVKQNNVLGAAVAFVAGLATKSLVDSLVQDIIMPIVGLILPTGNWRDAVISMGGADIAIGRSISALINFLIILFVIFVIVKMTSKTTAKKKKK